MSNIVFYIKDNHK